jgi:hypothetical protein
MSWLGKIFGTNKAVEEGAKTIREGVDWVGRGIDAAFYTEEEKAADGKELIKMRMGMVKDLQDQYAPRSLTRRVLAIIVFGNFFLHINIALLFWFLGQEIELVIDMIKMELQLVLIVAFFYFGYYGVKQVMTKKG